MTDTSEPWRHPLTLSSDYAANTPLSTDTGVLNDLSALHLDEDLQQALLAWQRRFEQHFRPTQSWDSTTSRNAYADQAPVLLERLRRALPNVSIELDLWPLEPDESPQG